MKSEITINLVSSYFHVLCMLISSKRWEFAGKNVTVMKYTNNYNFELKGDSTFRILNVESLL